MFHHALVFTDYDLVKLKKSYHALMQQLETGKEIDKHSMDELTEAMRVILQSQKELQSFWQQVKTNPAKHHHLHLTHNDKELLNLPWQIAIDTKQYPGIYISKGPTAISSGTDYHPQPGPLRILVMISSPEDLNYNKRLSYEEEEQIILKAVSSLWIANQVQVHFTEDGSLANLQQKLKQQHYHILYFSGHGIYKHNTGYLLLENPVTLRSEEVKAQELARAIKNAALNIPPLIILSSCQTAQGNMEEGFRGVADELIHERVPAVIAMAFSIKDQFNIAFVGHLFEHLANKSLLVEAYSTALQDLRKQELETINPQKYSPGQWLIPQLYVSRNVTHIVDWQAQEQVIVSDASLIEDANGVLLSNSDDYRFIGRRRECTMLLNELSNNKPVMITGQAGIGKTALAEYLVKRLIIQDTAYYCFAFNESTIGTGSITAQLLHYLKTTDAQYDASYEADNWDDSITHLNFLVKRVARLCKPVWVFDNLESCQQKTGGPLKDEYRDWMNYVQLHLFFNYPILFIGRFEIPESGAVFTISLNQAPYVDFYRKCIQLNLKSLHKQLRLPEPDDVVSLLYNMFGGNYRTLEFFNELYVTDPGKTLTLLQQVASKKDIQKPAKELMQDVHHKLQNFSRELVLSELIASLSQEERRTLHLLFHFDRPVLPLALEMQQPGKKFDDILQRLKNLTLIEEHVHKTTGRKLYYVGPLIRNSIEGLELPQVYFYPEMAGDYYFKTGYEVLQSYNELEAALGYYKMCSNIPGLNKAGTLLTNNYHRLGFYDATLHYGKMVEAIAGDNTYKDIWKNIGLSCLKFGNARQALAYFTKLSIACRKDNDDKNLSTAFNAIGQAHIQLKDDSTALEWFDKSLRLAKTTQNKEQEAITFSNIGKLYCDQGEYGKAMKAFQHSLKIRKKTNDRLGQVNVLNNISEIYGDRNEKEKQRETLQEALSIAIEIGNKHLQGFLLNNIGQLHFEAGDNEAALTCFQKNLSVSESIDDEEEIGKALWGMGRVYDMLGKYNEAVDHITKGALKLQKFDYPNIQTKALHKLGTIYIARGDAADALPLLDMALADYRKRKKMEEVAHTLYYIGEAYRKLDDFDNAITNFEECLSILIKVEDKATESMALLSLGQAYEAKNDLDKVLEAHEKHLALMQEEGDRAGEALSYYSMGIIYLEKELPDMYLYYLLEAYTIYSEENNLDDLYIIGLEIGSFLCENYPEKYLQQGLWFLEEAYEIGIQSPDLPEVEYTGSLLEQFRQKPSE